MYLRLSLIPYLSADIKLPTIIVDSNMNMNKAQQSSSSDESSSSSDEESEFYKQQLAEFRKKRKEAAALSDALLSAEETDDTSSENEDDDIIVIEKEQQNLPYILPSDLMNSPSLGSESPLPSISDPKKEQIQMSNNGDEKSEELEEQSPIKLRIKRTSLANGGLPVSPVEKYGLLNNNYKASIEHVKSDASTSSNYFNNESPCASKVRPPTHILPKLAVYRLNHDEISVDEVFDAIENGLYVCDNIKKPAIRTPKKKAPVFEGTKTPVKKGRSSIYSQCYISPEKLLEAIPSSEANNLRMNPSEICNFCRPQKECSKQVYGMHTLEAHSIHTRDSKQTIEYLNRLHAEQPNEFAKIEFYCETCNLRFSSRDDIIKHREEVPVHQQHVANARKVFKYTLEDQKF